MKNKRPKSLSSGRPPFSKARPPSLSAKATRNLIRSHHQLHALRSKASRQGDDTTVAELDSLIESKGGLNSYQQASILGQSSSRGGDSSKVLVQWLLNDTGFASIHQDKDQSSAEKFGVLEIGALSAENALSRVSAFDIVRIDLNAQASGIEKQDFMQRPLPKENSDRFDLVSLSLVLNYCPDPVARGEMLRRTTLFLRQSIEMSAENENRPSPSLFPALFLVLPAPCVLNSRYLDDDLLGEIMKRLGYTLLMRKVSSKLVYYLWGFRGLPRNDGSGRAGERKCELRSGPKRNNFCIILKSPRFLGGVA